MKAKEFTEEIANYAKSIGADLVGFAPVSRWAKAPIEHSPQGVYPGAKNVIVCACHFLDSPTELGAEKDPRDPGPALTEMSVSSMLQDIGFRVSKYLQKQGNGAMFVRQSGAWRYRPGKNDRGWMGDICHYYAAACAGLGEVGWSNITLTPEFGPRQRFVSIITDADLEATPLYDGPPLCDRCMMCAKKCPTQSFDKDVSGKMLCIECEDKKWEFPDRNMWRCAIGENFMLDVFLDEWKDQEVTEELILEMEEKAINEKNEWVTGWKMGMCLKYCMSKERRYWDRKYCSAPRRKRDVEASRNEENIQQLLKNIKEECPELGVDWFGTVSKEDLQEAGINLVEIMPDAESVIVFGLGHPENSKLNIDHHAHRAAIQIGKIFQEKYGFSAMPRSDLDIKPEKYAEICELSKLTENCALRTIITSAPLGKQQWQADRKNTLNIASEDSLSDSVKESARKAGADLVGISSVARIDELTPQLQEIFGSIKDYFVVKDQGCPVKGKTIWGGQGHPFKPISNNVELNPKIPEDYLPGAKSVIVIGLELLEASIENVGAYPGKKAGHFHTSIHEEAFMQLDSILLQVCRDLALAGFKAFPAIDLCGLASSVNGLGVDLTASRFAAVAAGLGELGMNGLVLTSDNGPRQRFACIITDADLTTDPLYSGPKLCKECGDCVKACPMAAIDESDKVSINLEGQEFSWNKLDRLRCDFAQRYGFISEAGGKYIGCQNDFEVPEKITSEYVCHCMEEADRIQRPTYTPTVEKCFTACKVGARE